MTRNISKAKFFYPKILFTSVTLLSPVLEIFLKPTVVSQQA